MRSSKSHKYYRQRKRGKLLYGFVSGILVFVLLVTMTAGMVSRGALDMKQSGSIAKGLLILSVLLCAWVSSKLAPNGKLIKAMTASCAMLLLLTVSALLLGGGGEMEPWTLLSVALLAALLGAVLGIRNKKREY